MASLIPVVLSGGAGARLWPVSREALPKPFIRLSDGESLLGKTIRRAGHLSGVTSLLAITNREYYFLTRDEYEKVGDKAFPSLDFLLEPMGRNTAPAICAAALHIAHRYAEDAILLVLPADHLVGEESNFRACVAEAVHLAKQGWLTTFGIKAARPETAFGYIEAGGALSDGASKVARFVEKPDLATAKSYVSSQRFSWNSGMFCFTAAAVLDAFRKHAPEVLKAVNATLAATDFAATPAILARDEFARTPDISFDRAVMEKTDKAAVLQATFEWSDVGSWNALAELTRPDADGNRVNGEAVLLDAADCFIQAEGRVVAGVGIKGLLIVDTPDALLVAHRDRAQDVKTVVERLKMTSSDTVRHHRTVHRPWGTYTVLEEGERFKLKRIVVKPGASLSLQRHRHRSEHWVVLSGIARVVNGETEQEIGQFESTFIHAGTAHRLSNPGKVDCVIIEIQTGDYLGEDDIVRLQDSYGRK